MSEFKNRLGEDSFVWWIGVVEDRTDPLNLGRCRVRIFGAHTDNLQELPTNSLPWATPLYPVNSSNSFGTPMEGDYVFGFFLDGMSKQAPAMQGVFPGIPQESAREGTGFSPNAKYVAPSNTTGAIVTPENDVKPVTDPETPAMKPVRVGSPTTPALSFTLSGTGVERSNNNRAHVCDIPGAQKFDAAVNKVKAYVDFTTLRTAIEGVSDGSSSSPLTTQVVNAIKVIRGYVRMVQKGLTFVNETIVEIASYLSYVRAMITWLTSLPAKLLNMLKQCLLELQQALTGALNFSASSGVVSELTGLLGDVMKTAQVANQVAVNAQSTVVTAEALTNPKSYGKA